MTPTDLAPLVNHLWQSTAFVAVMWLLTLVLRKNRAAVRYWLWLAASMKFLIPFSAVVSLASQLGTAAAPAVAWPRFTTAVTELRRPLAV